MDSDLSMEEILKLSLTKLEKESQLHQEELQSLHKVKLDLEEKGDGNEDTVMIHLGAEYWMEKSKDDALRFLDRRINKLQSTLNSMRKNLKTGGETLKNLQSLIELSSKESKNAVTDDLPIMDIQEEIDEDGNVISVTLNNEKIEQESASIGSNLDGIQSLPHGDAQDISKTKQLNNKKPYGEDIATSEFESIGSKNTTKTTRQQESETDSGFTEDQVPNDEVNSQIQELIDDMELLDFKEQSDSLHKVVELIEKTDISAEHMEALKSVVNSGANGENRGANSTQQRQQEHQEHQDQKSEQQEQQEQQHLQGHQEQEGQQQQSRRGLENQQIYELELIASEFEENDGSIEDEELEFDFDSADENMTTSEEEDPTDDLLYNGGFSLLPKDSVLQNRLWADIHSLREQGRDAHEQEFQNKETLIKEIPNKEIPNTKVPKSVRFSEKLDIREIEDVSESLAKVEHHKQSISKFKENRILAASNSEVKHNTDKAIFETSYNAIPSSEIGSIHSGEHKEITVTQDIFEREGPVSDVVIEHESPMVDLVVERESPMVDTIFERDNVVNDDAIEHETSMAENVSDCSDTATEKEWLKTEGCTVNESGSSEKVSFIKDIASASGGQDTFNRSEASSIEGDEQEFENLRSKLIKDERKQKRSKFKQMMIQNPSRQFKPLHDVEIIKPPQEIRSSEETRDDIMKTINSVQNIEERERDENATEEMNSYNTQVEEEVSVQNESDTKKDVQVKQLNIDTSQLQDDMDSMVQAYNVGMFDDDMEVSGPIVDKIEDFEKLNRIVESMSKGEKSMDKKPLKRKKNDTDSTFDETLNAIEPQGYGVESDEDDDDQILSEFIVENDGDFSDESVDFFGNDLIQQSVIDEEVVVNYHRMRERITANISSSADPELEPIDDVAKSSIFKARRVELMNMKTGLE
ncbi:putative bud site selection protein [Clavispora lusitaniae]|uniref:Bud site selection protein n=1 Tax=Clavispora lusitaniae TaxID=36911 RepID=A0ACD0WJD3_CLALS|nr:putative bud site selection protein [Clavispora lusitaniae]QFZ33267.1 putative bud site selection protein [Clavispora lusitaniae]QFZ38938.1 putative bud site selection protein [Clavispora lusitaniae]QFZ44620.1 putative bud site selection protein [Clavispora lusitaniae]QFZ50297.1 putative bud site selection protein [Clavispora lusitaniae]